MSYEPENPTSDIGDDAQAWLAREFEAIQRTFLDLLGGTDIGAMVWRGPWSDGQYFKNNVVTDEYWLAIANKDTTEKPAPQPTGDPVNVIDVPGTPSFATNTVSAAQLIVGTRYTNTSAVYVRQIRYQIPATMAGFTAAYYIVRDPLGDNPTTVNIVSEFTIAPSDTGSWKVVSLGLEIIPANLTFDVIGVFKPAIGSTSFTYEWDYKQKNGDPDSGEIWHQAGGGEMRVNEADSGDTDRSTDLDNIGPGSEILMVSSGQEWSVNGASKTGDVYYFDVEPATRAGENTSNFTFTYYAPLSMDYLIAANHYTTLSNVSGFQSTTGYDGNPTLNQNAYGVDINIQDVLVSDDWDFMAYSG